MKIDWHTDYLGEFICPKCNRGRLGLASFANGKRIFKCKRCRKNTSASIDISRRSLFLDNRLEDENINWEKDYKGEFTCPECQTLGMIVRARGTNNKRNFSCSNSQCNCLCQESCQINIRAIQDPRNPEIIWYTQHRYQEFICPQCNRREIYFSSLSKYIKRHKYRKKEFKCHSCKKRFLDCCELNSFNISMYSNHLIPIKSFNFEDDLWDLRAINPNFDERDKGDFNVNFSLIKLGWFKQEVKKYILYLCKAGQSNAFGTIHNHLRALRAFSGYLSKTSVAGFEQINRSLIVDYLAQENKITKNKLSGLRSFFIAGTLRSWFSIDPDIIRDDDYPKQQQGNPDPISTVVQEQIEKNLSKLPDPIARMWIVCFFAAMRPSELALLKKDCLVQEGQHWKLVWQRKKGENYHEVPITRTIAKVVQEQLTYINEVWGEDWEYLFCHYHGLSDSEVSQRLELAGTHINTPIYGYCGLDLDQDCEKFRACYTCSNFVAIPEKLPQYIKVRDELRAKQTKALTVGDDISFDLFKQQADQLDKIMASFQEVP